VAAAFTTLPPAGAPVVAATPPSARCAKVSQKVNPPPVGVLIPAAPIVIVVGAGIQAIKILPDPPPGDPALLTLAPPPPPAITAKTNSGNPVMPVVVVV
jgi:hypothetical protein